MTDEQILKKAIEKAFPKDSKSMWNTLKKNLMFGRHYYELIFDHSFAKAFWGEKMITVERDDGYIESDHFLWKLPSLVSSVTIRMDLPSWQFHLQQMVLEEEPLKYIERFL